MLQATRALDGAWLASASGRLARRGDRRGAVAARVLCVRQLVQAALLARDPSPTALRLGMAVDGLHAASMLLLAAADRPRRRQALGSALVSSGLLAATRRIERGGPRSRGSGSAIRARAVRHAR